MRLAPIPLVEKATEDNFDEDRYLASNLDVRAAVQEGRIESGRSHFDGIGHLEGRKLWGNTDAVREARQVKLERLRPHLRTDMPCTDRNGVPDYLSEELRLATRIVDTSNVSSNGYDQETLALIHKHIDGLVLDCGAGRRDVYHRNVVNFEIVAYDTTDVIGVGEELPFADNTFDAVLSIAVLEHVRDPFRCAQEIVRVLKPGGDLFCSVPFLQPLHGYPHHYFNATKQGISRLFEDSIRVSDIHVPTVGHPAHALHWFLSSWLRGLSAENRAAFREMRVADLVDANPHALAASGAGALAPAQVDELASAFVLRGVKP